MNSAAFTQCGSEFTGGHWDPTGKGSVTPYDCSTTAKELCEVGDLSGKYGNIMLDSSGKGTFSVLASGMTTADLQNRAIVFHCGSPRVACAALLPTADISS